MARIPRAFLDVRTELEESARRIGEQFDPKLAEIFHAHQTMLDMTFSPQLEFETELRDTRSSPPHGLSGAFFADGRGRKFAALENRSLAGCGRMTFSIWRALLRRARGVDALRPGVDAGCQRACHLRHDSCLRMLSRFHRRDVAAILVESLGREVRHLTALLAREKGHSVIRRAAADLVGQIERGEVLLVDIAFAAVVVISPTEETRQTFERAP